MTSVRRKKKQKLQIQRWGLYNHVSFHPRLITHPIHIIYQSLLTTLVQLNWIQIVVEFKFKTLQIEIKFLLLDIHVYIHKIICLNYYYLLLSTWSSTPSLSLSSLPLLSLIFYSHTAASFGTFHKIRIKCQVILSNLFLILNSVLDKD